MSALRILQLEDSPFDAELIRRELKKHNYDFIGIVVDTKQDFEKSIREFSPDIILADHSMPQFNSLEALKIRKALRPDIPFILITGSVSEEFAVECMKAGADDYILKNNLIRLPSSIDHVLSKKQILKEKDLIESLHKQLQNAYYIIEQKNKDITDSINYAKRIQDARLPERNTLTRLFPDSFLLFKPKDILSGDFYWFAERDGKKLIAACDCTGHGVPGALLSMIGNNILNQLVNEKGLIAPEVILTHLHAEIGKSLQQETSAPVSDGMDIALIGISNETDIEFAGAQRPLWIVRNNICKEIKGDKISIGSLQPEGGRRFTKNKFSLSKGDAMYIFSDGYADQFGGERAKKFRTKKFKELLLSVSSQPMERQKLLIDAAIENWKGNNEQVDDILVIGVRL